MENETKKLTAGAIARIILLTTALVNTGLNMAGIQTIPVNDEAVEAFINTAFIGVTALVAWYKDSGVSKKTK